MSAELKVMIEGQPPRVVALGRLMAIGRDPGNDLVINSSRASRRHAEIRNQSDKAYYLIDLGSSNGTILNGRRVVVPQQLKGGDLIEIGGSKLVFTVSAPDPAATPITEQPATQVEMRLETVSILVIDIRNYSGLSTAMTPEDLSSVVGKWFKGVTHAIETHGGNVDKFIGDAVMAVWLKPRTGGGQEHVLGPISAALEAVQTATKFHKIMCQKYPNLGFRVGCGINVGKAAIGNVGVGSRPEITAVGDSVNVAFRLEDLCKEVGQPIVVSAELRQEAGERFQFLDLGYKPVKGRTEPIHVFGVQVPTEAAAGG